MEGGVSLLPPLLLKRSTATTFFTLPHPNASSVLLHQGLMTAVLISHYFFTEDGHHRFLQREAIGAHL